MTPGGTSLTLDTIRLATLATGAGNVTQRTRLDEKHQPILRALDLPEPPRYHEFQHLTGEFVGTYSKGREV